MDPDDASINGSFLGMVERMLDASERPRRGIRVVVAADEPTISPRTKCSVCEKAFKKTHAVLVLDGVDVIGKTAYLDYMHRSCVVGLLDEGPVDVDKAKEEFDHYRDGLVRQYAESA